MIEDLGEVTVYGFEDGVDDGATVDLGLAEALEFEEVGMVEGVDTAPAGEDFVLIEVALDDARDGGLAVGAGSREEGAAALRHEELAKRKGSVDGDAFVIGP